MFIFPKFEALQVCLCFKQTWDKLIILFLNNKLINVSAFNYNMLYCLCSAAMKMYCEQRKSGDEQFQITAKLFQNGNQFTLLSSQCTLYSYLSD